MDGGNRYIKEKRTPCDRTRSRKAVQLNADPSNVSTASHPTRLRLPLASPLAVPLNSFKVFANVRLRGTANDPSSLGVPRKFQPNDSGACCRHRSSCDSITCSKPRLGPNRHHLPSNYGNYLALVDEHWPNLTTRLTSHTLVMT